MRDPAEPDMDQPRTNWAGNLTYSADELLLPNTVEEAREAVRNAAKLRVVGTRHGFNDIADTTGTHLSLQRLDRVVALDSAAGRVTVEAGMRYGDLSPYLHHRGHALHNLSSLPHISIAGACATATATHGSGTALGNLATAVAAIDFISAGGDLITLSRDTDGENFAGAVVGLGGLGVVTRLTLDIQPAFAMRQEVFRNLPLAAVEGDFDAIMSSGTSVILFTDWHGNTVNQVWIKRKVEAEGVFEASSSFFGAKPATTDMHPLADHDAAHCTEQMGVPGPWFERLPHFKMEFTPSSGEELQAEYFVPREYAVEVVKILSRWGDRLAPLLMISEIRTIAADDLWMSPCYQRPCAAFHFTFRRDWPAVKRLLPGLEEALAPFHPRPHWGKVFTMSPRAVQARYPKLASFQDLVSTYDPGGKFRNAFLERYIDGDS